MQKTEIDVFEGRDVVGWEAPQLIARLEASLGRAGFAVQRDGAVPSGVKPWRVSIAARIDEPDPESDFPGSAVVALSLRQKGAPDTVEVEASEQTKSESNQVEAVQAAAVKALDLSLAQAAAEARASIDLEALPDAQIVPKLADPSAGVVSAAVRILARRHNAAALPPLVERLKSDDLSKVRNTIGLLVELKEPSAVPAIIDASRGKNPIFEREIVFALSAIGGDDAEAYLDVVASAHDDPLVRASAEKALAELRDRKKLTKPAPAPPKGQTP